MTSFFRAYDLRGTYPDEIGLDEAERVGKAFGTAIDADPVLVGRDGRVQAPDVASAFIDGVAATGTDVIDTGQVATPVVRFGARHLDLESAAMVTASHNPPEYIGFKFSKAGGMAMSRETGMADIQAAYEAEEFATGDGTVTERDLRDEYVSYVADRLWSVDDLTVVANFGNGAAATVGRDVLEAIGCDVVGVNEEIDGEFPDHPPVPDDETAIRRVVERLDEADVGVIFDGDGDRVGLVLPELGAVSSDYLLALFARESLEVHEGKVVYSLDTSQLVPEIVRRNDGTPVEVRVGFTFISQYIDEHEDVVFAGEPSGHYAFPVFEVPWDDGIFGAGFLCQLAAETDLAGDIQRFPEYPVSPQLRIDCPEACKEPVVDGVAAAFAEHDQSTLDGVKIRFDDGWALVRPSNTEPKLSVRCEADTEAALDRIRDEVTETVDELIAECVEG